MSTFPGKLTQLSIESIFSHFERKKRVELKKKVPNLRSIHVPIHIPRLMFRTTSLSPDNDEYSELFIQTYNIFPKIWIEMSENPEKTRVTIGRCEKYSIFGWKTVFRNFLNFLVFRTGNTVAHLYLYGIQNFMEFFDQPPVGVNSLTMHLESEWPLDFLLKFQNLRHLECRFMVKVPKGYFKQENLSFWGKIEVFAVFIDLLPFKPLESLEFDIRSGENEDSLELLDLNLKQLAVYENSSSYDTFLAFVKKFSTGRYSLYSRYRTSFNLTKEQLIENLLLDVPARETSSYNWNPPQIFQSDTLTIDISDDIELNITFYGNSFFTCRVNNAGTSYPRRTRDEEN